MVDKIQLLDAPLTCTQIDVRTETANRIGDQLPFITGIEATYEMWGAKARIAIAAPLGDSVPVELHDRIMGKTFRVKIILEPWPLSE